ncbi:MAG: helix-turn-helix domain-containing protein [Candidatus Bathyarchaeota archaeon]|nr:helix-turn-helix domain-containing protein [Candidatus Termiticorpusculum sp.]
MAGHGEVKREMPASMFNAEEWLDVFPALDNTERFNILIYLANNGSKSFSEIKNEFKIESSSSVEHHLTKLMDAQLIENTYKMPLKNVRVHCYYHLTDRGKTILEILLKTP